MPKFKKNTDYSMKGSSFYGHGNSSPAKKEDEAISTGVGDAALVGGDAKLMQQKFKHKEPGWAKVASAIADTNIMKGMESMGKGAAKKAIATKYPKVSKLLGKAKARGAGEEVEDWEKEFQWGDKTESIKPYYNESDITSWNENV